jgi:hypothetical protein
VRQRACRRDGDEQGLDVAVAVEVDEQRVAFDDAVEILVQPLLEGDAPHLGAILVTHDELVGDDGVVDRGLGGGPHPPEHDRERRERQDGERRPGERAAIPQASAALIAHIVVTTAPVDIRTAGTAISIAFELPVEPRLEVADPQVHAAAAAGYAANRQPALLLPFLRRAHGHLQPLGDLLPGGEFLRSVRAHRDSASRRWFSCRLRIVRCGGSNRTASIHDETVEAKRTPSAARNARS